MFYNAMWRMKRRGAEGRWKLCQPVHDENLETNNEGSPGSHTWNCHRPNQIISPSMPDWQGLSRVSAKGLSHHTTWPFRLNMPRIGSGAFCMPSRGSMSETQPLPGPNIVPFQKNRPANSELPRMIFKGGEFQNSFSFHSLDLIYCICAICCTVWFAAFFG